MNGPWNDRKEENYWQCCTKQSSRDTTLPKVWTNVSWKFKLFFVTWTAFSNKYYVTEECNACRNYRTNITNQNKNNYAKKPTGKRNYRIIVYIFDITILANGMEF